MKARQGWKHQFLQNLSDDLETQTKILGLWLNITNLQRTYIDILPSSWAQRATVLLLLQ